jgi:LDH2 family malate/lactate/ureidoglycolate dehydrogenase
VMLPFGQHKGYCLGMLVELVSGGFTGAGSCVQANYQWDYPTVFMAVNIAAFEPLDEFRRMVDDMIVAAKAARKAPGVEEILVPGEPEWRAREKNLREGINVPETTWERIVASGAKFGVTVSP